MNRIFLVLITCITFSSYTVYTMDLEAAHEQDAQSHENRCSGYCSVLMGIGGGLTSGIGFGYLVMYRMIALGQPMAMIGGVGVATMVLTGCGVGIVGAAVGSVIGRDCAGCHRGCNRNINEYDAIV